MLCFGIGIQITRDAASCAIEFCSFWRVSLFWGQPVWGWRIQRERDCYRRDGSRPGGIAIPLGCYGHFMVKWNEGGKQHGSVTA